MHRLPIVLSIAAILAVAPARSASGDDLDYELAVGQPWLINCCSNERPDAVAQVGFLRRVAGWLGLSLNVVHLATTKSADYEGYDLTARSETDLATLRMRVGPAADGSLYGSVGIGGRRARGESEAVDQSSGAVQKGSLDTKAIGADVAIGSHFTHQDLPNLAIDVEYVGGFMPFHVSGVEKSFTSDDDLAAGLSDEDARNKAERGIVRILNLALVFQW